MVELIGILKVQELRISQVKYTCTNPNRVTGLVLGGWKSQGPMVDFPSVWILGSLV